jgi:hypothetical protein
MTPVDFEIVTINTSDRRYDTIMHFTLRNDPELRENMWVDGEHVFKEHERINWTMALVWVSGIPHMAACATLQVLTGSDGEPVTRIGNTYEVRGIGRKLGLWRMVHAAQMERVRFLGHRGQAFVFDQPKPVFEASGWFAVMDGYSTEFPDHHWHEMHWTPQG